MQLLKKYSAILAFVLAFPLMGYMAKHFILEPSTDIYAHIPQESDIVLEINLQNFVTEIAYQRIFEEGYFIDKIYPSTDEDDKKEPESDASEKMGFDVFSKMVLFREQWATENVWVAVVPYTNRTDFKTFVANRNSEAHVVFGDKYAIVQMNASENQDKLDEHLKKISTRDIKPFTERVELREIFDPTQEINCYVIPKVTQDNQIIEGALHFNFLTDHIAITGEFTPIPDFDEDKSIAYAIDAQKGMSMRSCLNVFNSIYWFNEEKIDNVPDYKQMAFDYDGVNFYLTKRDKSSSAPPFNSFPQMNLQFDIENSNVWFNFFDSLTASGQIIPDTITNQLYTKERAFFQYELTRQHFKLMQSPFALIPNEESGLYFDLQLEIDPLLANTNIMIDESNPPSTLEQSIFTGFASSIIADMRRFNNIEGINFQLKKGDNHIVKAAGKINMKEKNGKSIVESISFGATALNFIRSI